MKNIETQTHLSSKVVSTLFEEHFMGPLIGIACFAAWLTHIFYCFGHVMWGFLLAGAIFFPIGILHGFYLWFN
jgi:hypothetical protein